MSKSYRIGLLINNYGSDYSQEFEKSVSDFCNKNNCTLYVFSIGEIGISYSTYGYQKKSIASLINTNNLDGLIFLTATQITHISFQNLVSYTKSFSPLPVVSVGVDIPDIPSIIVDNAPGMREIILHLIEKHHCKKIGLIGVKGNSLEITTRMNTYRQTLKEKGISVDEDNILYGSFTYATAMEALETYSKTHDKFDFDAVVALNDDMAYACIDFCKQKNINLDSIKITGFDDLPRASFSKPTLSSVNQQVSEQGLLGAKTLFSIIKGKQVPHLQTISTKAMFRQSCGCVDLYDKYTNAYDVQGNRITYESLNSNYNAAEWYTKRDQLSHVVGYQDINEVVRSLKTIRGRINKDLSDFDLKAFALCMYQQPVETDNFEYFHLPHQTLIFAAFDRTNNSEITDETPDVIFDSNVTMIPENIISESSGKLCIVALYHCAVQYGYIIFRPGNFDMTIYDILCTTICSVIDSAYYYTKEEEEKTKLSENNQLLSNISRTDEMTGLLNRRGFMSLGQKTIDITVTMNQKGLVIFGDMDGLKNINDTYGHAAGDRAIKAEANLLRSSFRSTDIIGRLGGDEFAVVAGGLDKDSFSRIKQNICKKCKLWEKNSGEQFKLSISIGYAAISPECPYLEELLKKADQSQYREKKRKKAARK